MQLFERCLGGLVQLFEGLGGVWMQLFESKPPLCMQLFEGGFQIAVRISVPYVLLTGRGLR